MEEAFFQHNVVPRLEPTEQTPVQSQRSMANLFLLSPRIEVRCTMLPCAPVAPALVSSPPVVRFLPVWPTT